MKKMALLIVGVIMLLLGGLWLVQGLGLVHIDPVACVADCQAIEGTSTKWAIIGALVAAAGAWAVFYALKRPRRI